MIDERGRGANLDPVEEYICYQRLMAAIMERAIEDRTFLEELNATEYIANKTTIISLEELNEFASSKWREWLMDNLIPSIVGVGAAQRLGKARAHLHSVKTTSRKPAYMVKHNGEEKTLSEWAALYKLPVAVVADNWYRKGKKGDKKWLQKLLDKYIEYCGQRLSLSEIAKTEKVTFAQLKYQYTKHRDIYKAIDAALELQERKEEIKKKRKDK